MNKELGILLLAFAAWSCDKEPADTQVQNSPAPVQHETVAVLTGPQLPVENLKSEVVQPSGGHVVSHNPHLESLQVGQSGWVVPWTMWVTTENRYYINGTYDYLPSKPENSNYIQVTRTPNGFDVNLDRTSFEWSAINFKYPGDSVQVSHPPEAFMVTSIREHPSGNIDH